jgi:hypothetical protein
MSWFKYIFHKHKLQYYGRFKDQFIFTCKVCHREKKINTIVEGSYTPEKIDRLRKIMDESTSHLE